MERRAPSSGQVEDLLAAVALADGFPGLSEHKLARAREGDDQTVGLWAADGRDAVLVVAAPHPAAGGTGHWSIEIAVHPDFRTEEIEAEAVLLAVGTAPDNASVWASRGSQVQALIEAGFRELRSVIRMERPLPASEPEAPAGFRIEGFQPERDSSAVVAVNNRAFAGHREQGYLDEPALAHRTSAVWFEARGLMVAYRGPVVVGFCWTKVEEPGVGEIYVVAVDPGHQGRGLGRWLTLEGLQHLSDRRGAETGMLWVDGSNAPARSLYESLGFESVRVNREFEPESADQPKR